LIPNSELPKPLGEKWLESSGVSVSFGDWPESEPGRDRG